jgi:nuclear pore complex protein Nup205
VRPQTDSEIALASVFAPGHPSETKFDVHVRRQELLLRKAVIEYLGTASDFTEPEMTMVLSPVLSAPRHDERSSRLTGALLVCAGVLVLTVFSYDSDCWRRDRSAE